MHLDDAMTAIAELRANYAQLRAEHDRLAKRVHELETAAGNKPEPAPAKATAKASR